MFVIVRKHAYNILKSFGDFLHTPGVPGFDLPGIDYVALASGYGLAAERVEDAAEHVRLREKEGRATRSRSARM